MGSQRVGHDWVTFAFTFSYYLVRTPSAKVARVTVVGFICAQLNSLSLHFILNFSHNLVNYAFIYIPWNSLYGVQFCGYWQMCRIVYVVQVLSMSGSFQPMDCSTPDLPVLHCLPELAQTHVHWIGDAIQPSHARWPPSPPTFSLSQHQGLFQVSQLFVSCGQSIGASPSASVLPVSVQGWFPGLYIQSHDYGMVYDGVQRTIVPSP